jgi:hypothetical protein
LNVRPSRIEVDGTLDGEALPESGSSFVLSLPRGQHLVQLTR